MIEIPEDPIEVIIQRVKHYAHVIALHLQDEAVIIGGGMRSQPNDIELQDIGFESLPQEDVIDRKVEQYRSPLLLACSVTTRVLLEKYKRSLSATRPASNR